MNPNADDEWILVGGCQCGWCLLPRADHRSYLRGQAWAASLGLLTLVLQILFGA